MRVKEAFEKLKTEYEKFDEDKWKEFLDFCSKFHKYSLNNKVLIFWQKPNATLLKGYRAWQEMDRQVRKGESGIHIFAPIIKKYTDDEGKKKTALHGYRVTTVFDISQTDGDDSKLPTPLIGLQGEGNDEVFENLMEKAPVKINIIEGSLGEHGSYNPSTKEINVKVAYGAGMLATLVHELSHHYHHEFMKGKEIPYEQGEFVAESSSYIINSMLGLDTKDYSIPYIKSWLDDFSKFQTLRKDIEYCVGKIQKLIEKE